MSAMKFFLSFTLFLLIASISQPLLSTASSVEKDVETAFGLYSTGLWDDTIRFLKDVYVLADSYKMLKNYSNAITWYRRYTEKFVNGKYYATVLHDSAWIHYEQNNLKEAELLVTTLLKFLDTHPTAERRNNKAKIFLGHILFNQGTFCRVWAVL